MKTGLKYFPHAVANQDNYPWLSSIAIQMECCTLNSCDIVANSGLHFGNEANFYQLVLIPGKLSKHA